MSVLDYLNTLKSAQRTNIIPEGFALGKDKDIVDSLIDAYSRQYQTALFGEDMIGVSKEHAGKIKAAVEKEIKNNTGISKDLQKVALFLDNITTDPYQSGISAEKLKIFQTIATKYIQTLRQQKLGDKTQALEAKKQEMMIQFQKYLGTITQQRQINNVQELENCHTLGDVNEFNSLVYYHKQSIDLSEKHTSAAILADFWFKRKEFKGNTVSKNESTGKITIKDDAVKMINGDSKKMLTELTLDKPALYHIIFRHIRGINTFRERQGDCFNGDNISDINDALSRVDKILSVIINGYTNMNDTKISNLQSPAFTFMLNSNRYTIPVKQHWQGEKIAMDIVSCFPRSVRGESGRENRTGDT